MTKLEGAKQVYVGIDVFKLIAAFMVVMIHTPRVMMGEVTSYLFAIIPVLGVPFFFCCSGFFLGKQLVKKKIPWKQIKRLALFYCIWSIIYLPFTHYRGIVNLLQDFFIFGFYFHLWYIPALVFGLISISLIRSDKLILVTSVILFCIGVLGSGWYEVGLKIPLLDDVVENTNIFDRLRRIFSFGFGFTALGYMLYLKKDKVELLVKNKINYLFVIAIFFFLLEMFIVYYFKIQRDVFLTFFLYPLVIIFFLKGLYWSSKISQPVQNKSYLFRSIANCVYFVHPLLLALFFIFRKEFPIIYEPIPYSLLIFILSSSIGFLIVKINNPFLNRLIQ